MNITATSLLRLDTLQNQPGLTQLYIETLDVITRSVILNILGDDTEDSATLSRLRTLQMIRRSILSLAIPPDVDDPEDDTPTASL